MNYYFDTEFIEGFLPNRILGIPIPEFICKRRHAIELISISIVDENGRTYSAFSSQYNYEDASDWVKNNVIRPLYKHSVSAGKWNFVHEHSFHIFEGKTISEIKEEILRFIPATNEPINFYGYFSDYDHVLLSSIFGTMMDLPKHFPMYTKDLKQMLDANVGYIFEGMTANDAIMRNFSFDEKLEYIKEKHSAYPKVFKEHLAEYDALFNKELHAFIRKFGKK